MKRNQGFSLIELIVVVAVMAILMTVGAVSFSVITSQRVKSSANETRSILQSAQTVAMSKDNCFVQFKQDSEGDIEIASYSSESVQLDDLLVSDNIEVTLTIGTDEVKIGTTTSEYRLRYVRESGAFNTVLKDGADTGKYCTKISFSNGRRTVELELATLTGKISQAN